MNIKEQLSYACKIVALEGHSDMVWGHITCRDPEDPARLFMKPAGMGFEEIEPDDLVEIDLNGKQRAGLRPVHNEVYIHTEIMRVRHDVNCVVHTHPPHAIAFSSTGRPLLPIGHEGCFFSDGLPVFTKTADLIVTPELGKALAETLGQERAVLIRNHGIATVGASVPEGVFAAILLEKACKVQMLAEQMGGAVYWTNPAEAHNKKEHLYNRPEQAERAFQYFIRRLHEFHAND